MLALYSGGRLFLYLLKLFIKQASLRDSPEKRQLVIYATCKMLGNERAQENYPTTIFNSGWIPLTRQKQVANPLNFSHFEIFKLSIALQPAQWGHLAVLTSTLSLGSQTEPTGKIPSSNSTLESQATFSLNFCVENCTRPETSIR